MMHFYDIFNNQSYIVNQNQQYPHISKQKRLDLQDGRGTTHLCEFFSWNEKCHYFVIPSVAAVLQLSWYWATAAGVFSD